MRTGSDNAASCSEQRCVGGYRLNSLLKFSRAIDAVNRWLGRTLSWLVLAAVLISATNAVIRKLFGISSLSLIHI